MKPRPDGFLGEDKLDHHGEVFDYIDELHSYLWRFVRSVYPAASGGLSELVDRTLAKAEGRLAHGRLGQPYPVLYLDLDGTVRNGYDELGRFVNKPSDVEVYPEAKAAMLHYKQSGWRIVAISNQGGIALGHVSMDDVAETMLETQRQCAGMFDAMLWCRHHPEAKDPVMAYCLCRKPRYGLIVEAQVFLHRNFGEIYPPHLALLVGDREEDRQCADGARITFMWAKDWRVHGLIEKEA